MRRWHWWMPALVVIGVIGMVVGRRDIRPPAPGTMEDQLAIYRAIRAAEPSYGDSTRMYEETALPWQPRPGCTPPALADNFPDMDPALLATWCATNHTPHRQNPLVITELGLASTNEQLGALVSSAIQFDAMAMQALVVVFVDHDRFGKGTWFWLVKEQGRWHIRGSTLSYIS